MFFKDSEYALFVFNMSVFLSLTKKYFKLGCALP